MSKTLSQKRPHDLLLPKVHIKFNEKRQQKCKFVIGFKCPLSNYTNFIIDITNTVHYIHYCNIFIDVMNNVKTALFFPFNIVTMKMLITLIKHFVLRDITEKLYIFNYNP